MKLKKLRPPFSRADRTEIDRGRKKYFSAQFGEAALEKTAFRLLAREGQGVAVGSCGVGILAQTAEQIGPGSVGKVVVGQIAAAEEGIDEREAGGGAVAHGDSDGAV